jgi:hypothetical protein
VFRPNLPVQIHAIDLVLAAVSPAFPEENVNIGVSVIPGEREATANYLCPYRGYPDGRCPPNTYVQGYERLKVGQLGTTFLKLLGGDNPVGASQITLLMEMGLTHVVDMPDLSELQFNGSGVDTHMSHGADGTEGMQPADLREGEMSVPDDGDGCASATNPVLTADMVNPRCLRQNPTAQQDTTGFGSEYAYGYRFINLTRYDDAIFGANIENLFGVFHDVGGVAPGAGQNFIEGRKTFLWGIRFDYLSQIVGEVRYTWFTGGGNRDALRDRDNLQFWIGYQF